MDTLVVHFRNDHRASITLQEKYKKNPFSYSKERLFITTEAPTWKIKKGGTNQENITGTATTYVAQSPTSRTLYLSVSKEISHHTTPATFWAVIGWVV